LPATPHGFWLGFLGSRITITSNCAVKKWLRRARRRERIRLGTQRSCAYLVGTGTDRVGLFPCPFPRVAPPHAASSNLFGRESGAVFTLFISRFISFRPAVLWRESAAVGGKHGAIGACRGPALQPSIPRTSMAGAWLACDGARCCGGSGRSWLCGYCGFSMEANHRRAVAICWACSLLCTGQMLEPGKRGGCWPPPSSSFANGLPRKRNARAVAAGGIDSALEHRARRGCRGGGFYALRFARGSSRVSGGPQPFTCKAFPRPPRPLFLRGPLQPGFLSPGIFINLLNDFLSPDINFPLFSDCEMFGWFAGAAR